MQDHFASRRDCVAFVLLTGLTIFSAAMTLGAHRLPDAGQPASFLAEESDPELVVIDSLEKSNTFLRADLPPRASQGEIAQPSKNSCVIAAYMMRAKSAEVAIG